MNKCQALNMECSGDLVNAQSPYTKVPGTYFEVFGVDGELDVFWLIFRCEDCGRKCLALKMDCLGNLVNAWLRQSKCLALILGCLGCLERQVYFGKSFAARTAAVGGVSSGS
jgi:hypothetical protein